MLPDFSMAEEKNIVFLDPIDEATELEEEEDAKLMQSLFTEGKPVMKQSRTELARLIERELEAREQQQRDADAAKEVIQQQIRDEQKRQSEVSGFRPGICAIVCAANPELSDYGLLFGHSPDVLLSLQL